jgi:hypothetical protein
MQRIKVTLDAETLRRIRSVAGPRGVSSFLDTAARERLARLELQGRQPSFRTANFVSGVSSKRRVIS